MEHKNSGPLEVKSETGKMGQETVVETVHPVEVQVLQAVMLVVGDLQMGHLQTAVPQVGVEPAEVGLSVQVVYGWVV
jgi:hypothetical protein